MEINGSFELAAVIDIVLVLSLYFAFWIVKLVSKPTLGTTAFPIIFDSAVGYIRSTNWYSVDLDKHSQFQNISSAMRTIET